jgi:hypothetical protein
MSPVVEEYEQNNSTYNKMELVRPANINWASTLTHRCKTH